MAIYLRTSDGQRILFDTKKIRVIYEETEYDLTGVTLDVYDFAWEVAPGTIGEDALPARILRISDQFTGISFESPMSLRTADTVGYALAAHRTGLRAWLLRMLLR